MKFLALPVPYIDDSFAPKEFTIARHKETIPFQTLVLVFCRVIISDLSLFTFNEEFTTFLIGH